MSLPNGQTRRYRRLASLFAAVTLLWFTTLATAHALGHALDEPEPTCSICLAAGHAGHGVQHAAPPTAPMQSIPTVVTPTTDFRSFFHSPYASRAPPSSSAVL